jgi:hypothetical protein
MTVERGGSPSVANRLALGLILGAALGTLALVFDTLGLLLLALIIALSALVRPRYALLAGMLLGAGGVWLFFSLRAVVFCATGIWSCSGPPPELLPVVSGVALAVGLGAMVVTRRRFPRSK